VEDESASELPEGYEARTTVYIGKRLTVHGKLLPAFEDQDVHVSVLDVKVYGGIGSTYRIVHEIAGSRAYTTGQYGPRWIAGPEQGDPRLAEWALRARLDALQLEHTRAEKRSASDGDAFRGACAPLRALYQKHVGYGRRAAFLSLVMEEVTR
jgi:hypothetical protein